MPVGDLIRLGRTEFTEQQFQYFQAGIRAGYTRSVLRESLRDIMPRGFSNEAFAAGRALLTDAARAGIETERLTGGQRLGDHRIPFVAHSNPRGRYQVNGSLRYKVSQTGELRTIGIAFHTDNPITADAIQQRAEEIAGLAESHYGVDIEWVGWSSLSVTRAF